MNNFWTKTQSRPTKITPQKLQGLYQNSKFQKMRRIKTGFYITNTSRKGWPFSLVFLENLKLNYVFFNLSFFQIWFPENIWIFFRWFDFVEGQKWCYQGKKVKIYLTTTTRTYTMPPRGCLKSLEWNSKGSLGTPEAIFVLLACWLLWCLPTKGRSLLVPYTLGGGGALEAAATAAAVLVFWRGIRLLNYFHHLIPFTWWVVCATFGGSGGPLELYYTTQTLCSSRPERHYTHNKTDNIASLIIWYKKLDSITESYNL